MTPLPTRRDQILRQRPRDETYGWRVFRVTCDCDHDDLPQTTVSKAAASKVCDDHAHTFQTTITTEPMADPPRVSSDYSLVEQLFDALRDDPSQCLRLTPHAAGADREAFVQYDPHGGDGESSATRPSEFYWFESGTDDYGHPDHGDGWLTEPELAQRLGAWQVDACYPADRLAAALVKPVPETRFFWADSLDALEAQIQAHYPATLAIAEKEDFLPPEVSFVVDESLRLRALWPEAHERDDAGWHPDDHAEETATDQCPSLESTVFFETTCWTGQGRHVVELPNRARLRDAFADARPPVETAEATVCSECDRRRPATARFCDWCGRSLTRASSPSRIERAVSWARSLAGVPRVRLPRRLSGGR